MHPSAIWYPAPSANSVSALTELSGLTLPSPPPEGALVYVGGAVNEYYRFVQFSVLPVNGTTVLTTILGGNTRWLKTTLVSGGAMGPAGGDLSGNYPNPTVVGTSSPTFAISSEDITYSGGASLPGSLTVREYVDTTDATPTTLGTGVSPAIGQAMRVISEVVSTDGTDGAWFLTRGVWLRTGAMTYVAISSPVIVDSSSTAGAATWTAAIAPSGAVINTTVTGEVGKNITWSLIRETVETT